uniref:Endonuclease/exonuclease/phosphatase domain-containing protein n=1 Tax=Sander lucioperca TaxID=283035 RepID=A0A8C9ZA53_SANLU
MWPGTKIADGTRFVRVQLVYKDDKGRVLIIDCEYNDCSLRILNIYAPNVDTERKIFFKSLHKWYSGNMLFFGDFNVAQTPNDLSMNNIFKGDVSRNELKELMRKNNLCDVWRTTYPKQRTFSRRQMVLQVLKQSRIDLCLVST